MSCADEALKALDGSWRTETEIFARVASGSRSGIRHGLNLLASQKRAEMKVAPPHGAVRNSVYVYRLAQPKE